MMKKALLLFCLLVLTACNKSSNQQKLDAIFDSDNFDFQIQTLGCLRNNTDHFTLEKQEAQYLLTCKETQKSKYLSIQKVSEFKSYFASLLASKKEKYYCCSGYFKITASTFFNTIEYDNSDEWSTFNEILKFTEIIPKP